MPTPPARPGDLDAAIVAEVAELEGLAAAMPADEVESVPPVCGPQDWG